MDGPVDDVFIVPEAGHDSEPEVGEDALADVIEEMPDPIQPDGPSVLTFINGMADLAAARVCFAPKTSGGFALLSVAPLPDDSNGLPYAHALSLQSLPGAIEVATTDVRPVVFGGKLSAIAGKTCADLSTVPDGVHWAALEVIPAGTLSHGRSVLMVAAGCVGGPDHVDSAQDIICGTGYSPAKPTARLFVASMDRTFQSDRIGLQVFAASLATPLSQVDHVASSPSFRTTLASSLAPGGIVPRPPNFDLSVVQLGSDPASNDFELFDSGQPSASASIPVGEALARGGLSFADFVDGRTFTAVLIGPRAGLGTGAWWQGFTITLVRNDP